MMKTIVDDVETLPPREPMCPSQAKTSYRLHGRETINIGHETGYDPASAALYHSLAFFNTTLIEL
jgi:hypothetical protein